MPMKKLVYRKSDNVFLYGGNYDPVLPALAGNPDLPDSANYGIVEFEDDAHVDTEFDRADPLASPPKRLATAQELADAADAKLAADSELTSRQKDVLTTCALIVRARGIAAWNAMTTQQKKTAALAEANVWRNVRIFIEKNT